MRYIFTFYLLTHFHEEPETDIHLYFNQHYSSAPGHYFTVCTQHCR